jgi:homeobox protein ESX1
MSEQERPESAEAPDGEQEPSGQTPPEPAPRPREVGGTAGPEPTRYGDWEHRGRCTDF